MSASVGKHCIADIDLIADLDLILHLPLYKFSKLIALAGCWD